MPKTDFNQNWGIVGHQPLVDFLKKSIKSGRSAHAYIFHGQEGLGKKRIAKSFIAALLCSNPVDGAPCRKCSNCEQLEKGIHPDVLWIKRETDPKTEKLKKNITIEQIRDVKDRLTKGSFLNSYKIAVIDQAELMSIEADNALLKLLEEPAQKVIVILLARRIDYLPKTILSRCQKLKLEAVKREEIYDYLLHLGASRQTANELSCLANGRPGVAVEFFKENKLWETYQEQARDFLRLATANSIEKLKTAKELSESEEGLISQIKQLQETLDIWALIIRDVLLLKNSREEIPDGLANLWLLKELKTAKISKKDSTALMAWLRQIEEVKRLLHNNVNPQLALESLLLNFN